MPLALEISLLILLSLLASTVIVRTRKFIKHSRENRSWRNFSFPKTLAFATVLGMSLLTFTAVHQLNQSPFGINQKLQANALDFSPADNWYQLKISIGDLTKRGFLIDQESQKISGTIKFNNATTEIINYEDLDSEDKIELIDNQLRFDLKNLQNERDTVNILLKPTNPEYYPGMQITLANNQRYEQVITVERLLHRTHVLPLGVQYIALKATNLPQNQSPLNLTESVENITPSENNTDNPTPPETVATPDISFSLSPEEINATPELSILQEVVGTPEVTDQINLINDLIQETSSSPEVLTEYIPTTEYVDKVTTVNAVTKVDADPKLINVLSNQPEIVSEISATPDLNFIFVPNQKVEFSPQKFSFAENRTTKQKIGEIIFVQNRDTGWNTYVTIDDFVSQNGRYRIPSENITVEAGEIKKIRAEEDSKTKIESGGITNLGDTQEALLVNIQPKDDSEAIFSINPTITVNIPPNTPPGIYRANISIKSL